MLEKLHCCVDNPLARLIVGVILLATSLAELLTDIDEGIQAEHGIVFYAIFMIIKTLPELQHSLENISSFRDGDKHS